MKKRQGFVWIGLLLFLLLFSCVENYRWDDISKDGVISHDNGIFIPVGSLDTIRFQAFEVSTPAEVSSTTKFEGLFSEDFYKNFVIPINGKEEAIGQVAFSGNFVSGISNPGSKQFSDIIVSGRLLKKNGDDTGIHIANQTLHPGTTDLQSFNLIIAKEEVLNLKNAHTLLFVFDFSSKQVEESDYLLINNLKFKSSGGIRVNWE